jgi:hypothetical protein
MGYTFDERRTLGPFWLASLCISQALCLIVGWQGIEHRGLAPIFAGSLVDTELRQI